MTANPLDAIFQSQVSQASNSVSQRDDIESTTKAEQWLSNKGVALNEFQRKLNRELQDKPEGVTDSDILLALGFEQHGATSFTLDGEEIICDLVKIAPAEIEEKTEVHPDNGRSQDDLTDASIADILPSIKASGQNTFPGIGHYLENGKIQVVDSSRRRMACIKAGSVYSIFVARRTLTLPEARKLADISRLTKSLSSREYGVELLKIQERNPQLDTLEQLAEYVGRPLETVRVQTSAAKIPEALIAQFPEHSMMTFVEFKDLVSHVGGIERESFKALGKFRKSRQKNADNELLRAEYDKKRQQWVESKLEAVIKALEENDGDLKTKLAVMKAEITGSSPTAKPKQMCLVEYPGDSKLEASKKHVGKSKVVYSFNNQPSHILEELDKWIKEHM
ncbi:Virulence regulon transcriptional activator VirB [Vibrio thalassae]|uniref:Virulence regulon transcriptional activator VirB n=1 Tax=Vibrio thalassae TaxID=1243014 RepID=A0A240EGZ6_9VIBR|nr:hypothetical protein [Vibrio thalassae]SNX47220.1 Virulence regulon transcriptional activator VirB [Vibrio thalassae]